MENIQSLKAVIFNQAAHSLGSNTPQLKYPSVTADSTSPQLLYPLKTSETLTAGCQSGPRWRRRSPSELSESRRDFRPSPTSASGPAGCSVGNETRGRGGEQDEMTHYTTGWCVCVCEEASSSPPPPGVHVDIVRKDTSVAFWWGADLTLLGAQILNIITNGRRDWNKQMLRHIVFRSRSRYFVSLHSVCHWDETDTGSKMEAPTVK